MANVLLTERCVRSCPYCFAKEHMNGSVIDDVLPWDGLIYIADFFQVSGEKNISLLGGEPTLHPDFTDYVMYLIERGFHVNVFTSGILSECTLTETTKYLSKYPIEKLSFVCNLNHPSLSTQQQTERIGAFLDTFGKFTSTGYNIYEPRGDMEFLADYINRYGLKRHIRLGLAHPIPGEANKYVTILEMPAMADRLLSFAPLFAQLNIGMGFDCGFPLCLFTDEQLGVLFKLNRGLLSFGCGPAIDIGTDLSVWSCFPLSKHTKKSLYDFNTLKDIMDFYRALHRKIRIETGGLYEKCDACRHRETEFCSGGCIAHIVSWLRSEERIRPGEVYA